LFGCGLLGLILLVSALDRGSLNKRAEILCRHSDATRISSDGHAAILVTDDANVLLGSPRILPGDQQVEHLASLSWPQLAMPSITRLRPHRGSRRDSRCLLR